MISSFIIFGGVMFWIFVGIVALVLTALINDEKAGLASAFTLVAVAVVVAFSNIPFLDIIKHHPMDIVYGVLAYFVGAGVWATAKWRLFFLPNLFDRYDTARGRALNARGLKDMPADQKVRDEIMKEIRSSGTDINNERMVSRNKARITTWMFYWPFSLLSTFIGDFLHRVITSIYKSIAGTLQTMSDRMASRYTELN